MGSGAEFSVNGFLWITSFVATSWLSLVCSFADPTACTYKIYFVKHFSFALMLSIQFLEAAQDGRADDMVALMNEGIDKDFVDYWVCDLLVCSNPAP